MGVAKLLVGVNLSEPHTGWQSLYILYAACADCKNDKIVDWTGAVDWSNGP